jgi:hypothetical protein
MAAYQNIPKELREAPLWLQYYLSRDPKKPDKKPRKHPTVKYATPEDRAANLKALDYLVENRAAPKNGGGYQRYVQSGEGFVYVDLDKCRDPKTGEVKPWAQEIIAALDTYTEISGSGTGFHLIARGQLPDDFKLDPNPVEIFSGHIPNKLMALTGDVCDLQFKIETRQKELERLLTDAQAGKFGTPSRRHATVAIDDYDVAEADEPLPPFPQLPGALGRLVDGITADIPYDHKALAAITYMGIGLARKIQMLPDHWLQPRFYACMVGPPASAKSAAEFEVRRALADVLQDVAVEFSIDSGPALVQALDEHRRLILAPDELADQFEKCRAGTTGRNSLFGELLKLYESNETANRTKLRKGEGGKVEIRDGMFALIGGTTTQRFPEMWTGTGGNASGLQSRFVLSYSEHLQPRWKTPNDEQTIVSACTDLSGVFGERTLKVTPAAEAAYMEWRKDGDAETDIMRRLLDQVKRFAMVIAACHCAEAIDEDIMCLALKFGDYQLALRAKLFPPDASSTEQVFENLILRFLEKQGRASEAKIQNRIAPERRRGGYISFNRAWNALLHAGKIVPVGENRNGQRVYALRADATSNVQRNSAIPCTPDAQPPNVQGLLQTPCTLDVINNT